MARRFRRKSRARVTKRFRRAKFRSRRRMTKGHIRKAKPVSGRLKMKGTKMRLNPKPEVHFNQVNRVAFSLTNFANVVLGNMTEIWSNIGVIPGTATNWYPIPVQGTGSTNIVGTKWNSLYAEVSFVLVMRGPDIGLGDVYDFIRIMVVKERQRATNGSTAGILKNNGVQMSMNSPINTLNWEPQFDKLYSLTTGYTLPPPSDFTSISSRPLKFRFIIPLKDTLDLPGSSTMFDRRISIFGMNLIANLVWTCPPELFDVKYYFRDP